MVNRKKFIQLASMSFGTLVVPNLVSGALANLTGSTPYKEMATGAFNAARARGASYADVRIVSNGMCVRVLVDNSWGYAASGMLSVEAIDQCVERAVASAVETKSSKGMPQRYVYHPKDKFDHWSAETFQ